MATAADLENILIHTWNPDKTTREGAERALQEFFGFQGSLPALCTLVSTPAGRMDRSIRQAATIAVKNNLRKYWLEEGEFPAKYPSTEAERADARGSLLEALLREADNSIRSLLSDTLKV